MSRLSPRTRRMFREHLTGTTLQYIEDVFGGAGLSPGQLPEGVVLSGQRRSLVEAYYAAIDWSAPNDERRLLAAYTHILKDTEYPKRHELTEALRGDGYEVRDNGEVMNPRPLVLGTPPDLDDPDAMTTYERRIHGAFEDDDPDLAIGTAKELIEAVCKQLLADASISPDPEWSLEKLYKEAAKNISLDVDHVSDGKPGAESIKKVLRGLVQVVSGTAELRNRFGTGHGRHRRSGLQRRHAELVTGASLALARFLLATRTERSTRQQAESTSQLTSPRSN